jgi:hypothetical protein
MTAYPFDVLINSGGIGGNGGGEVSIRANTGGLVERVGVWASGRDIVGVSIKFTNDEEKQQMGSGKWGEFSEFVFESAETVQSLSLWGNGKGTNLGRIKFTTSKGRTFDWGGHDGKQEYPQDVGSGLWVGIKGRCGGTVDLMGVYFLKKVDSMSMKDVKFKNDPTGTSNGIKSKSVKSVQYAWNGKPYEYSFEQPRLDKEVHTVTETNSQTTSLALGMRQQWENKVDLFIDKSTVQVEVSESIEHTWTSEKSTADGTETSDGMTPGAKGSINGPEDAVVVEAITYVGSLDLEYTATIVVKLESGTTYNIPTKGTMKKVAYSKIYLYVRPIGEDTTLPPGENENRSAYDEQVDAGQEGTPGYEPTQDDQTAWSSANEEDDQYNKYFAPFQRKFASMRPSLTGLDHGIRKKMPKLLSHSRTRSTTKQKKRSPAAIGKSELRTIPTTRTRILRQRRDHTTNPTRRLKTNRGIISAKTGRAKTENSTTVITTE